MGIDHIDLVECSRRGIKVGHTPNLATDTVAEATIGLTIAASRKFKYGMHGLSNGSAWDELGENIYALSGHDIHGSTVGIVGLGRIGKAVAKRLTSFGVARILYSGTNPKALATEVNAEFVGFDYLLEQSDFVICCCSLKPENVKMFNSAAFKKMKKSAVFINISRGAVVDQEALYKALKTEDIFSAGLDVTDPEPLPRDHPLLSLSNCLILPHIGSSSFSVLNKSAELSARNVLAGLRGEPLITPVAL